MHPAAHTVMSPHPVCGFWLFVQTQNKNKCRRIPSECRAARCTTRHLSGGAMPCHTKADATRGVCGNDPEPHAYTKQREEIAHLSAKSADIPGFLAPLVWIGDEVDRLDIGDSCPAARLAPHTATPRLGAPLTTRVHFCQSVLTLFASLCGIPARGRPLPRPGNQRQTGELGRCPRYRSVGGDRGTTQCPDTTE